MAFNLFEMGATAFSLFEMGATAFSLFEMGGEEAMPPGSGQG